MLTEFVSSWFRPRSQHDHRVHEVREWRELERRRDIWEKLFVLMTLGDDRNIAQTWVAGRPVWQRDAQEQAA